MCTYENSSLRETFASINIRHHFVLWPPGVGRPTRYFFLFF